MLQFSSPALEPPILFARSRVERSWSYNEKVKLSLSSGLKSKLTRTSGINAKIQTVIQTGWFL
jgi:hypothetical protein